MMTRTILAAGIVAMYTWPAMAQHMIDAFVEHADIYYDNIKNTELDRAMAKCNEHKVSTPREELYNDNKGIGVTIFSFERDWNDVCYEIVKKIKQRDLDFVRGVAGVK